MEIVVKRIAKKETYTIGRLYLLADGDVKRKALSGKTAGDKAVTHTYLVWTEKGRKFIHDLAHRFWELAELYEVKNLG